MALFKPGPTVAEISGSIGGITYARNRGGMYMRNRSTVVNPNTLRQVAVRDFFTVAAQYWSNTLTPAQRAGWNAYGNTVIVTNPLGEQRKNSGFNWFIAVNTMRQAAGLAILAAAPTNFPVGPSIVPTFACVNGSPNLTVSAISGYTPTAGTAVFIARTSQPMNPGVNFYKGPFTQIIAETLATGSVPPFLGELQVPYVTGRLVYLAVRLCTPDGRVGPESIHRFPAA